MKTAAAILVELGQPLLVDDLEIPPLAPGQALVEIHYSGVCHTQLLEWKGYRGPDKFLPHCLGHEGSGCVLEAGPGVSKVRAGDKVILSWMRGSGAQVVGTQYDWNGRKVNAGPITTFSRHAVISESRLTRIGDFLSMDQAALMGCALPTGLGAALNTAQARPGSSAAVFGTGGIGLSAIAGLALTGCTPILAVDVLPQRLKAARDMGATHEINPHHGDPLGEIRKICPGGVDLAIEASGHPSVMKQALASVRNQGGIAVIIGNAPQGECLSIDPRELNQGKQLRGTWGGDNQPDQDFPRYVKLLQAGKINWRPFLGETFTLERINQALEALEQGTTARPLVAMLDT